MRWTGVVPKIHTSLIIKRFKMLGSRERRGLGMGSEGGVRHGRAHGIVIGVQNKPKLPEY